MKESTDPSFRQVLSLNPQMVRGRRGLVILGCAVVGMLCINCFAWVVPPPNIGAGPNRPVVPHGMESLLPLSIAAMILLACSLVTMAFVSMWTTLNPPPAGSRSYFGAIMVVLVLGFFGAWCSGHGHLGVRL